MKTTSTNTSNIDILDFIPRGKDNAKSRTELRDELNLPDRTIRALIHDARITKNIPIVNVGQGYYIVDESSDEELEELYAFINMMKSRQVDISETVKALTSWVGENV